MGAWGMFLQVRFQVFQIGLRQPTQPTGFEFTRGGRDVGKVSLFSCGFSKEDLGSWNHVPTQEATPTLKLVSFKKGVLTSTQLSPAEGFW